MPSENVGCCCPFTDADLAARKLVEIANGIEEARDGSHLNALARTAATANLCVMRASY